MKSNIKSYGVLVNVWYYLKVWAKTFPIGLVFIVVSVPINILIIYQKIRIPKIIVAGVEQNLLASDIIMSVLIATAVILILSIIRRLIDSRLKARGSRPLFYMFSTPVNNKLFSMRYQKLIDGEIQSKINKVKNVVVKGSSGNEFHFFGFNLTLLLTAVVGIVIFSGGIIQIDLVLLLLIFLSGAINLIYGFFNAKYTGKITEEKSENEKKLSYVNKTVGSNLFAKDIRLYNLQTILTEKFNYFQKVNSKYLNQLSNAEFIGIVISSILFFVRDFFAYFYLIRKLMLGNILISEFIFLTALVMEFSKWMDAIVLGITNLAMFSVQMDHMRDFIDVDDDKQDGDLTSDGVAQQPSIEFKNISYRYPESEKWIFKNFNLKINPSEKLALVGINGAGKTTLMHLLMGLLEPQEGEILIDGKKSTEFKIDEYYKLFSPVFQDINIFPETIAANISGSDNTEREKLLEAMDLSGLKQMLDKAHIGENTYLVKTSRNEAVDLSGGQSQRMLLARALYKNAKINILDEPTAALDPIAESQIYEEYNNMSKNKTSIFISHRLASTKFCDRIIMLENGKIIEEGTHDELMYLNGKYKRVFDVQSKYYQENNSRGGCENA